MPKHKQAGHTTVLTKKTANIARKRLQCRSHPHRTLDQSIYAATQLPESRRWSIPQHFKGPDGRYADKAALCTRPNG